MAYFLSEARRKQLHDAILELDIPENIAREMSEEPDGDIDALDSTLAAHAHQAGDLRDKLQGEGFADAQEARAARAFMMVNVLCLRVYREEAAEREIDPKLFPKVMAVMVGHLVRWTGAPPTMQ